MNGNLGFAATVVGGMALVGGTVWMLTAPPATAAASASASAAAGAAWGEPVYYRGCGEVRAAGAAPLHRGEPGYRIGMDGDGDGVACEAYSGGAGVSRVWHFGGRRRRR